ncbi:MAG TPA: 2-oxoacid:ferredoxin oxidoreductase subunit beta [Longimicrobiales bacterium]
MTSIQKPRIQQLDLPVNALGLTRRDYEGAMSTLCAGCGHDSITAAIVRAFWELDMPPHKVAKLSGIGCSSKTPAYFLKEAHGFNAVHGRMPSIATGAAAANRELVLIGVSGDGDSLSIGLGQFCHGIRRNINMLYILENNGVYGLTKGQFSASADVGSKAKRGEPNRFAPIDPVLLALTLGATFVARCFSGDKEQLVPIIKAGLAHRGFAFIDVISPCVTFNDHEGSTKSYRHTRERAREVVHADLVEPRAEITVTQIAGDVLDVRMHDGSIVRLRKVSGDYDPTDRDVAYAYVRARQRAGEVCTGMLYLETGAPDLHGVENTVAMPLVEVPFEQLCPGSEALDDFMEEFR